MSSDHLHERLNRISTMWTILRQAHDGSAQAAAAAQELLLQRYRGAVYRYLLRVLGDAHAASPQFGEDLITRDDGLLAGMQHGTYIAHVLSCRTVRQIDVRFAAVAVRVARAYGKR
jgi:hypothetical protein